MATAEPSSRRYLDWLIPSPAIPLALYFCVSSLLPIAAPQLGIQHPAYWIFGYLGICVLRRLPQFRIQWSSVDLLFFSFVAVIFVSWSSTGFTGGGRAVALFLSSAIVPWVTVKFFRDADATRVLQCVALFGSAMCLAYVLAIPFLPKTDTWERVSFMGGVAYGNIGPTVGVLAVMSAVYLMRESAKAAWIALPAAVIAIVHMGGRGMLVSVLVAVSAACLCVPAERARKARVLAVVLVSVLIGLVGIPKARWDHFLRLGFAIESPERAVDDTIGERLGLYREAAELFLAHPLAGVGAGRFGLETASKEELTTPHSTVFQVIAELGLLGTVPFVALNLILMYLAYRARMAMLSSILAAVWIYFAVFDQISANYLSSFRYYLFSALLVAVSLTSTDVISHRARSARGSTGPVHIA